MPNCTNLQLKDILDLLELVLESVTCYISPLSDSMLSSSFLPAGLGYDARMGIGSRVCRIGGSYLAENSSKDSSCPWEPVSAAASADSLLKEREEEEKAAMRRAGTAAWMRRARGAAALRRARMKEVEAIVCVVVE